MKYPSFYLLALLLGLLSCSPEPKRENAAEAYDAPSEGLPASGTPPAVVAVSSTKTGGAVSDTDSKREFTVAFYNVENLYDTQDDPAIDDNDFLPDGKQKWNQERYEKKLAKLAEVIKTLGDKDGPEILGFCEIENLKVLEDLAKQPAIASYGYKIVHFDSPDRRGIDVALFYKTEIFELTSKEKFECVTPKKKPTRDVLLVNGKIKGKEAHFIVNHFPSRREGESESEPNRLAAAETTRNIINKLLSDNPKANIFVMGDFNDEPTNNSITDVIRANENPDFEKGEMKNLFAELKRNGRGTYNFKGEWNMLDQMMVSKAVMNNENGVKFLKADIWAPDYIKDTNPKYKGNPFRTFAGTNYLGGYSDHFPIYAVFAVK
jgi:predicted extracellular nuclease